MSFKIRTGHKRADVSYGHVAVVLAFAMSAAGSPVDAQEPAGIIRVAVLQPVADSEHTELARELADRIGRRLEESDHVLVAERPVLSLHDLQFSVGCRNETETCMKSVADLLEVDTVVVISVHGESSMSSLSVVAYDAEPARRRGVNRHATGNARRDQLFDEVDSVLSELFGIEPPPVEPEPPSVRPRLRAPALRAPTAELDEGGTSPVGWIFLGTGVLAAGAGAALGFVAASTEEEWAASPTATPAQVDTAIELRERGERESLASSLLIGIGAAAMVSGLLVLVIEALSDGDGEPDEPRGSGLAWSLETGELL
jgi:hypothetical protein